MHIEMQIIVLLALTSIGVKVVLGASTSNELTPIEFQALAKFRPLVKDHLYKEYMNDDHYLIRFLRARNLNIQDAKVMLLKSLEWRKANNIDSILEEHLVAEKAMLFSISADREHRPVGTIRVGEWNIRRMIIGGKENDMVRVIHKIFELGTQKVRDATKATGKNVTQVVLILDMAGFTNREHACLLCMRPYFELFGVYENSYPQIIYKIFVVNTPRIFQSIWEVVQPVMSQYTKESITLYGFDKGEWKAALLKLISNDQIPTYLGGTFAH